MIIENGRAHITTSAATLDEYGATIQGEEQTTVYPCQWEWQRLDYSARVEGVNYAAKTVAVYLQGNLLKECMECTDVTVYDSFGIVAKSGVPESVEYLYAVDITKLII